MAKKIIVIGSGFGGLAASLRLKAKGYKVTLVEKHPDLGGRARVFKKDSISDIQKISENIAASIIENISGDKLNESSIKATVEDVSKKTIGKYL